ncbi:MAG: ABC transporter permease, partial [Terriglobia bacterium]
MHIEWRENLRTAAQTIRAHKVRAALTILGIVIGVFAVISVAAIIEGLDAHIANQVQQLGARTFFVTRFPAFSFEQWPEEIRLRKHFTYEDALALRAQCASCQIVTPFLTRFIFFGHRNEIRYRNQKIDNPIIRGAEPDMPEAVPVFVVKEGRMFSPYENEHSQRVAVLGLAMADSLFGRLDPVGQSVRVNGIEFRVVGVWEEHQGLFGGPGVDQFIIIPYNTFVKLWPEIEEQILAVTVEDPALLPKAEDETTEILRRRRRVPASAKNDF